MLRLVPVLLGFFLFFGGNLAAQVKPALGVGFHSEGGFSNPGIQLLLSSRLQTALASLAGRAEIWGAVSRDRLVRLNDLEQVDEQRRSAGIGVGLEVASTGSGTRPYIYVTPTYSLFDFSYGSRSSWEPGLTGGLGLRMTFRNRAWFVELSWRGHGDFPFDDTAIGALTVGAGL